MSEDEFPNNTLERILNAAEEVFAQNGYRGTTLRQITQKAHVNLASVNYHHGGKESLYLETIRRYLQPINEARLAELTAAEASAGDNPVPLALIFQALARPAFTRLAGQRENHHATRLLGRCLVEPLPFMEDFIAAEFQPTMARFAQALRRHDRKSSPGDFLWRLSFVTGALHHSLATLHDMKTLTRGICQDHDQEGALHRFVEFAAAVYSR